jgi:flavodoxin
VGVGILAGSGDVMAASISENENKSKTKRSLIMYASRTNNTTKVAERFKSTLEKNGWQCDIHKIEQNSDPMAFPYNIKDYDLVCAGSGIRMHSPYAELLHVIRAPIYGFDPRIMLKMTEGIPLTDEDNKKMKAAGGGAPNHSKIVLGPGARKTLAFATYGGYEFGPGEAQPALDWINLEMAHLHVEIVGKFCCPGKFLPTDNPAGYHNDLTTRPNEKDLLRAELFIEQVLEA